MMEIVGTRALPREISKARSPPCAVVMLRCFTVLRRQKVDQKFLETPPVPDFFARMTAEAAFLLASRYPGGGHSTSSLHPASGAGDRIAKIPVIGHIPTSDHFGPSHWL